MNEMVKKALVELVRVLVAALLAAVGIQSTGCVASGNNASAAFSVSSSK